MRRILTRPVFPLLAGALLAGCVTTGSDLGPGTGDGVDPEATIVPLIDVAQRKADVAAIPSSEREWHWCRDSWPVPAPALDREATITGPNFKQESNAQHAGNALFALIESYFSGTVAAAEDIRDTLEEGVRKDAFTVLLPYRPPEAEFSDYNPMNEPVFQVANFMVPLAHAYLIIKHEYSEDDALIEAVKHWGNRLFQVTSNASDDFVGEAKGADRRVQIAAGWASWGNAANNHAALAEAYRYYLFGLASIGPGGADQFWVRQPHLSVMGETVAFVGERLHLSTGTVGPALVTAHALHRSGAGDVYTVAPGGGSIVEGAAWLWNELQDKQPENLLYSRHGGSEGVGWIELFVHEFPEHPLASDIESWLADQRPLFLGMGGGPTTCLYRRVPHQA